MGGLTGSRIAGCLARIPVELMLSEMAAKWLPCGFVQSITVCSWIDNLVAFSNTIGGAIGMLEDCREYLQKQWGLELKHGSTEYLTVWGNSVGRE